MMHVRCSQLTADPQLLAGCVRYIERSVRPHCEIRAVEDYALVFSSARKPSVPA
jgi:hypothetical protein